MQALILLLPVIVTIVGLAGVLGAVGGLAGDARGGADNIVAGVAVGLGLFVVGLA